jgi:hypothetical protein
VDDWIPFDRLWEIFSGPSGEAWLLTLILTVVAAAQVLWPLNGASEQ